MSKKNKVNQQCVAILDQQNNCLIDNFCYFEYPSICQWKHGSLPTTESTTMTTTTTSTPFTSNKPTTRITVCDFNKLQIVCPKEYSIYVFGGFYGRTQNGICGSSWQTNCNYDATISFRQRLRGFQSISINNFTSNFVGENPCPGVTQYAIIDYLCIPNNARKPDTLTCDSWMKTASFIRADGLPNYCDCSNNLIVPWNRISDCEPITTTFYYYEGFVTRGLQLLRTTTQSLYQNNVIKVNTNVIGTTTVFRFDAKSTTTTIIPTTGHSNGKCLKSHETS